MAGILVKRKPVLDIKSICRFNSSMACRKAECSRQLLYLKNAFTDQKRNFKPGKIPEFPNEFYYNDYRSRYILVPALFVFCLCIPDWKRVLFFCGLDYKPDVYAQELYIPDLNHLGKLDKEKKKKAAEDSSANENKQKIGFRDRKIIEYENRIRVFSTPDKTFRYFATFKVVTDTGYEIYMTPDDLIRAITPNMKQPDGLGLDHYIKYDPKNVHMKLELALDEDSIFFKLGSSGLISFSDYIFLLTVLSTSKRHFEIAFRMFDLNGDGEVDCEEFEKVATLIRQQTSIGSRHRDHANTGNTFKGVNSALTTYFFGENRDKKLTIEKFLEFQEHLQREILSLEFQRKDPDENGKISEADFTELLLAYAGYSPKKKSKMVKRVKKMFKDETSEGISREDYLRFFHFLNNINDVDTALTFYNIASASIDQATLKHVAKTVAHVDLSDHVINVIFTIFDENQDGQLSNKEFISVMKNRLLRGLEKPKDTGFIKFIQSLVKCGRDELFTFHFN